MISPFSIVIALLAAGAAGKSAPVPTRFNADSGGGQGQGGSPLGPTPPAGPAAAYAEAKGIHYHAQQPLTPSNVEALTKAGYAQVQDGEFVNFKTGDTYDFPPPEAVGATGQTYGNAPAPSFSGPPPPSTEQKAGAIGKGALSGAAVGASIGSAVPVIGTAIGAVGGAIIGGVATAFTFKWGQ